MIVASSENSTPYDSSFMHYLRERTNGSTESKFRAEMYEFQQSYFASGVSRFLPMPPGVSSLGTDADFHYINETRFFLAVERARYEDSENMVFGQGLNRLVSNVMQNGFVHDGKTPDKGFNIAISLPRSVFQKLPPAFSNLGRRTFLG